MAEATPLLLALAVLAGFVGGAMNALAGGGTFATLPALIAFGVPSTLANATSIVALQPGAMMGAWPHRHSLHPVGGLSVGWMAAITFVGGGVGACLLMITPAHQFNLIIPWLLLMATIVLAGGKAASQALARHVHIGIRTLCVVQFLLGIYGGYFGGAVGLMMAAAWGLLAGLDPHEIAGHRTLMLATANAAAALLFIAIGMVAWTWCLPMLAGALPGGYAGSVLGRRLPAVAIRIWTLLVTAVTTVIFFVRAYG